MAQWCSFRSNLAAVYADHCFREGFEFLAVEVEPDISGRDMYGLAAAAVPNLETRSSILHDQIKFLP